MAGESICTMQWLSFCLQVMYCLCLVANCTFQHSFCSSFPAKCIWFDSVSNCHEFDLDQNQPECFLIQFCWVRGMQLAHTRLSVPSTAYFARLCVAGFGLGSKQWLSGDMIVNERSGSQWHLARGPILQGLICLTVHPNLEFGNPELFCLCQSLQSPERIASAQASCDTTTWVLARSDCLEQGQLLQCYKFKWSFASSSAMQFMAYFCSDYSWALCREISSSLIGRGCDSSSCSKNGMKCCFSSRT